MVDKQLQIIFHSDLVPNWSTLRAKSEGGMSIGMSEGVGKAREEPNERYSKVKRIILSAAVDLKGLKTSRSVCYFLCEKAKAPAFKEQWSVEPWQICREVLAEVNFRTGVPIIS